MKPHRWQVSAVEAYDRLGGVFVGLDPGAGKTYAAASIARRSRGRPLALAPAAAIPQTRKMYESYGVPTFLAKDHPDGPPTPGAVGFASYTWLTGAAQAAFFHRFKPTDVSLDEFHEVRNVCTNSAAKRLERWLISSPGTRVAVFTGSPMTQSVLDFGHGLTWALRGHVRALVPATRPGMEALAGRLLEDAPARAAFYARLRDQAGVFLDTGGEGVYAGEVRLRVVEREPVHTLPDSWELPDGYLLVGPAQAAEVSKQLAWGYWTRITPRPSEAYLAARREWAFTVRRVIETGAADTELQVRKLRPDAWAAYLVAEDAEPLGREEHVWEDDSAVAQAMAEAASCDRPTIVWAHHRGLQVRAAQLAGCPHHAAGARSADGTRLDESRARLVVASVQSCHQSFNAQHFSHSVVLEPQADPEVMKQLVCRTARQGQTAPFVTVDLVVNCQASKNALRASIERARLNLETVGKTNPLLQLEGKI